MSSHTAPIGFGPQSLRKLLHTPQKACVQPRPTTAPAMPWLERLARWAEHQPMHHHMGSCRWL